MAEPNLVVGLLWFVAIAFMFFAQHHVCDSYFVPAINVFVEKMRKSERPSLRRWGEDAVAGATICALGCNGPELFSNLISLYTGSDAGIGVVIGSEIFNLLIIIGCAVICAPSPTLELERVPFVRDCFFYFLSIIFLYFFMADQSISFEEACVLLGMAAVYVGTVYFTDKIVAALPCVKPADSASTATQASGGRTGRMHGVEVQIQQIHHSRMTDGRSTQKEVFMVDPTSCGIHAVPADERPAVPKAHARGSIGFQYTGGPESMMGPMLKYEDLREVVVMSEGVIELDFRSKLDHVTLRLTCSDADQRDKLLENIAVYSLGRAWKHNYDPSVFGAISHLRHALCDKEHGTTVLQKLLAIPHFIVDFLLKGTLWAVDVKDIRKESRWPLCFMGAMFWLAVFSYCMLMVAEQINHNIPVLTPAFLGITVCAIGTSFPNAVASIIMAKQNKPAAAVANALGSNVQNVFLAMALPWVVYSAQALDFGDIEQNAEGIQEGVLWMLGTLLLVIFFVLLPKSCTISQPMGYILIMVFLVYLSLESYKAFS